MVPPAPPSPPTPSPPTPRPLPPRKPIGVLRGIAAAIGIIIMALSGGCALLLVGSSGFNASDLFLVLPYAAPPFLVGLGIWALAVKAGR